MPELSRAFIKTALLYLAGALLVGIALTPPVVGRMPALTMVGPAYVHLLVVGWLTQLVFGVAYWLFPRHSREAPYGDPRPVWLSFGLLNAGLLLRLVAEPAQGWHPAALWSVGLAVSALLQWLAVALFAAYLWKRVKTR